LDLAIPQRTSPKADAKKGKIFMANTEQSLVVGIFDDATNANEALVALQRAGFRNDQLQRSAEDREEHSLFSGIKGLFSGEKAPDKDILHDLTAMGIGSEEAHAYQQAYESHHTLVLVRSGDRLQEASAILLAHGAYGPGGKREASSDTADTAVADNETREATTHPDTAEDQRMRLHAEQLQASKRPMQTGEITIHKEIITEQQTIDVPVRREEVVVERRSLAEDATSAETLGKDETIRIPVSEEQVNVSKQTVTTGEVTVSKREVEENRQFSDAVRHEEARVEQQGDIPFWEQNADQRPPAQPGI